MLVNTSQSDAFFPEEETNHESKHNVTVFIERCPVKQVFAPPTVPRLFFKVDMELLDATL